MKRKKAAIVIAIMMSVTSLCGCGNDNSTATNTNKNTEEQVTETKVIETTEPLLSSEIITDEPEIIFDEPAYIDDYPEITTYDPDTLRDMMNKFDFDNEESDDTSNTSAVFDDTNAFVGTINGEDVIGYLDSTYTYHLSGDVDYNASFVTFDKNGEPEYEVYIRMYEGVPAGTYSDSGKNDRDKVFLTVYTVFDEKSQKFGGSYSFWDSDKSWTMELTNAEYSDDGVFKGTVEGIGMPGRYNHSPAYTELPISGSFNFQMRTIHPTMETYRTDHPEYDAVHEVSYVQSFGTPSIGLPPDLDDSDEGKWSVDHTCRTCRGSGVCQNCYGLGNIKNRYNYRVEKCVRCQGTGKCPVCYGTGEVH